MQGRRGLRGAGGCGPLDAAAMALALAAQHRGDQGRARQLGGRAGLHDRAVAHHREAVAEPVAFGQPVADEQQGDAVGAQPLDHPEQHLDLGPRQRRGGFVEDQHARAERDAARDRHHLLLAEPERAELGGRVHAQAVALHDLAGQRVHAAPIDQQTEASRLVADEDVLGHAAFGDQVDFLVDRAHAPALRVARRGEGDRLAVEVDRALVERMKAGQHLDQRRFAGAVLADQAMYLAGAQRQRDVAQRTHHAEGLGRVARLEHDPARLAGGPGGRAW